MALDIKDGTPAQAPAQVAIDTDALAASIVTAVQRSNGTQNQAPTEDDLVGVVAQLRASGMAEEDIHRTMTGLVGLQSKTEKTIKKEISDTMDRVVKQQRASEVQNFINRTIRSLTKGDELLTAVASTIRENAISAYLNSKEPEVVNARNRHVNGGVLDEDVLEALCERSVTAIESKKGDGSKKSSSPALGASTVTSRPSDEGTDPASADKSRFNDRQNEVYSAHLSQMRRIGKSPEDAEKSAVAAALRFKK
jgi:hypothetical protein